MTNILLSNLNFHHEWARNSIIPLINLSAKVAILPFSFNINKIKTSSDWDLAYNLTNGKYSHEIIQAFVDLGINQKNIVWLNYFNDSSQLMNKKLDESEIVFLPGGLPDKTISRIHEKKLFETLLNKKTIIGVSAGALVQLSQYFVSPDEDYPEFEYKEGLGLIKENFYVEVHYNGELSQRSSIQKVLNKKSTTIYGITNEGMIIFKDKKIVKVGKVFEFYEKQEFKN